MTLQENDIRPLTDQQIAEKLRADALREVESAGDEQALEAARVRYLGRSGSVSAWGEQMKTLSKEEKPVVGKLLNEVRTAVTSAIPNAAPNRCIVLLTPDARPTSAGP